MDVSKNDHKTLSGPLEAFSQNIATKNLTPQMRAGNQPQSL